MSNSTTADNTIPETVKEVQQTIGSLHNYARNYEDDYHQIKAVKEISKVLFVKFLEEDRYNEGKQNRFSSDKMHEENSASNWINQLFSEHLKNTNFRYSSNKIDLSDVTIRKFVYELEKFNLSGSDIDIKGVAYEKVLEDIFRGDLGQFFTPRSVVKFMVGILDPVFDPKDNKTEKIIDPAVGSGGFLTEVLNYYSRQNSQTIDYDAASKHIYGIDKSSWLLQICNTNLQLHTKGNWKEFPHIYQGNSLKTKENSILVKNAAEKQDLVPLNSFDKLIANPPFGSEEDQEVVSEFYQDDESAHKDVEALFIKRSIELVRPGGEIAIIVPKTIIKGPKFKDLRSWIWNNTIVNASIHLPLTTFRPFKAEIQTAILHLTKRDGNLEQGPVYFDAAGFVGHDGQGNHIPKNDLPAILAEYQEWRNNE